MNKPSTSGILKWLLLAFLVAFSLWIVLPLDKKLRLGLDIQGGTSYTVQITEDSVEKSVREKYANMGTDATTLNEAEIKAREDKIKAEIATAVSDAQKSVLEVIRNRFVDKGGNKEPIIYAEKNSRIVVQLPGSNMTEQAEAARLIESPAYLEFRLVHSKSESLTTKLYAKQLAPKGYSIVAVGSRTFYKRDGTAVPGNVDPLFLSQLRQLNVPYNCEFMLEREIVNDQEYFAPFFVEKTPQLTGDKLKKAQVERGEFGRFYVSLQFGPEGKKKFADVTSKYRPGGDENPSQEMGRQLAIVLDGTLYSAPVIKDAIYGGNAIIEGDFTQQEVERLATALEAGALPVPVQIVARRVVDPTLGADSVKSGIKAGVLGCVAIFVLMALYYMVSGMLADVALVLNLVLLPLGMALVTFTLGLLVPEAREGAKIALPVLTLPGIAGIALAIGMAVDANVLIFERMREEQRTGKGFASVVQAGFDRAFSAIFDSNITSIIVAVILFVFGSGPVRGYSVTLAGGLLVSMYTAVIVTRMCFNLIGAKTQSPAVFRMLSAIKPTAIDFMGLWKPALVVSVVIIAVSWTMMVRNYGKDASRVLGIDFTGGASLSVNYEQRQDVGELRSAMVLEGIKDPTIQYQREMQAGSRELLQVKVASTKEVALVEKVFAEKFPQAGFSVIGRDEVGPQVSADLKKKAGTAMALSLVAIIIYISLRFKFGFALGAVVALLHDVLVTAGVCHLLGFQINMLVIAALMTIVGYSVNDTIVIFDRIREDLRLVRNKTFVEICNLAMNETLGRTLLTNFLTFVSVLFLLILGGESLRDFSAAMLIGMIAGTYSTMYIATPIVLAWYRFKRPDLGSATN